MFDREMRDLAHVPRWSVLRRQANQSVVEHSWFVTMYALELVDITGWKRGGTDSLSRLMQYALVHDLDEIWTGDVPGPGKRLLVNGHAAVIKSALAERMRNILPQHYVSYTEHCPDIKALVRCADMIDAVLYLCDEFQLGNMSVGAVGHEKSPLGANYKRLRAAWDALPWNDEYIRECYPNSQNQQPSQWAWGNYIVPAVASATGGISRILVDSEQ